MLDLKTLTKLNQRDIESVRVFPGGIFQLKYDVSAPYFYPNGQMIPHTDEIVMYPHINSTIKNNTIRYSAAMIEGNEDIWYWSYYDLNGKKLADNLPGDHDGPDNSDAVPRPAQPENIPQMYTDKYDTQKVTRPTPKGEKVWDTCGAYWFVNQARFFQVPAFRNAFDARYTMLMSFVMQTRKLDNAEYSYIVQYLNFMATMDSANRNRYSYLRSALDRRMLNQRQY